MQQKDQGQQQHRSGSKPQETSRQDASGSRGREQQGGNQSGREDSSKSSQRQDAPRHQGDR